MDDYIFLGIIRKIKDTLEDIKVMLEKKDIVPRAADWLQKELWQLYNLCENYGVEENVIMSKLDDIKADIKSMEENNDIKPKGADWLNDALQNITTLYAKYTATKSSGRVL
jgi:DNA repair ATPase RecN